MKFRRLPIVKQDEWLEPVKQEVFDRYMRYKQRLQSIQKNSGSLNQFADAYQYFGIHFHSDKKAWVYREWAPAAHQLFLVGDFNGWNEKAHPLKNIGNGIWELVLPYTEYKDDFIHGSRVKVVVHSQMGVQQRIPAYIQRVVQDDETKDYCGQLWFAKKYNWKEKAFVPGPLEPRLIYECHIGMAQERAGVGTYAEFTRNVVPKVKNAGYNTIQIMAIAEHPYYGSFGYHVSNFFAPSSKFGTPEELKELIDTAHQMGIAVIMDLVHSHTVKNVNEGLNLFDGSEHQYFHAGERGNHPDWDSKLFDYGKTEVLQFLLSNIKYWLKEFHFDGFRFDGVSSMLYWHHGHDIPFTREKYFNQGVEYDAVTYLQLANKLIHSLNKNALSIAEDVSGMPGLCNKISDGGLGFDFRLAMGIPDYWIKILKEQKDEDWNIYEMYSTILDRRFDVPTIAYAESHDQALVGDKTLAFRLMDKEMYYHMSIDDQHPVIDRGIALHKLFRFFTLVLGGDAYMNFMGNEFGHPEWIDFPREGNNWSYNYARRQWSLAEKPDLKYKFLLAWDNAMIDFARTSKVLSAPFPQLLNNDDWNKSIAFTRGDYVFLFNFHINLSIPDYEFPVPEPGEYQLVLTSDNLQYGGFGRVDPEVRYATYYNLNSGLNILRVYNVNRSVQVFKHHNVK